MVLLFSILHAGTIDLINGEWEWNSTSGGYRGNKYTPLSEGYSKLLKICVLDSVDDTIQISMEVYKNDTLICSRNAFLVYLLINEQKTLSINGLPCNPGCDSIRLFPRTFGIIISYDSLNFSFSETVSDGYSHIFKRINALHTKTTKNIIVRRSNTNKRFTLNGKTAKRADVRIITIKK